MVLREIIIALGNNNWLYFYNSSCLFLVFGLNAQKSVVFPWEVRSRVAKAANVDTHPQI